MQREIRKYLFDIKESIEAIEQFLGEKRDFTIYSKNKLLRRGVERELGIIGEAMGKLIKADSKIEISNPRRIIDLRNWVIHGYDKVDDVIIWGIVIKDIPILKKEIEKLFKS